MPYDDPDPEDPSILVGVALPASRESIREMAFVFAEEFAALGFDEGRLLAVFKRPFYAGAHQAFLVLGETEIREIIRESQRVWGGCRVRVRESGTEEEPCPR